MTDTNEPIRVLGIAGSLRDGSFNQGLIAAAAQLAPSGMTVVAHGLGDLPMYDGSLELPASVVDLKRAIQAADGLLIASPEFNYGIPGVLKNALDWASRPAYRSVLAKKPVALVSAAPGMIGGARGQSQLKQVLLGTISLVFPFPELVVSHATTKFNQGRLEDEETRGRLEELVVEFARFVEITRPFSRG